MTDRNFRRIQLLGFVQEVKHIHDAMPDRRFCFILGAGASRSSGIPMAGELALEWLKTIHQKQTGDKDGFAKWLHEGEHGIQELPQGTSETDTAALASAYPAIYRAKWGHDPVQGHAELERQIDRGKPNYGYYALAEILSSDEPEHPSRHDVVITTNFDDLVAEALNRLGKKRPHVIGHSDLARFARPKSGRPLIIKVHHDVLLAPKNSTEEVNQLGVGYAEALTEIFKTYTPIVIGYGGNDGSLMGFLKGLPEKTIPGGIYWCHRSGDALNEDIKAVVTRQHGTLVEIPDFDIMIVGIGESFGLTFDPSQLTDIATRRAKEITKTNWWRWQVRIQKTQDINEISRLYEDALITIDDEPLLFVDYAEFLIDKMKDNDQAEQYYKKALKADPKNPIALGNYAHFLMIIKKEHANARQRFEEAITADPYNVINLGNYATFLTLVSKEYDRAEDYFKKALAADPNNATNLGYYANFLTDVRKDHDRAEEYYKKAIAADPNNAIGVYP